MNILFFGNTKYSVIDEEILHRKFGLSLIITIPDKPSGRKRELKPSPVKKFALENNIPVLTFERLDSNAIKTINSTMKQSNPLRPRLASTQARSEASNKTIDFIVVADYGLILPNQVLELPRYAAINVHHSLLPKYRGPSPAPTAILNGEKISGVTIIKMTWDVDAGDILAQKEYELQKDETTDSLLTKLNKLGGQLVIEVIQNLTHLRGGGIAAVGGKGHLGGGKKQDESKATYTHRFSKSDGQIDLNDPPDPIAFDRMIRAFYPWPGVWSKVKVKSESDKEIIIKFLPGNLIQPEGKKPMSIKDFLNGYPNAKNLIEKLYSS